MYWKEESEGVVLFGLGYSDMWPLESGVVFCMGHVNTNACLVFDDGEIEVTIIIAKRVFGCFDYYICIKGQTYE